MTVSVIHQQPACVDNLIKSQLTGPPILPIYQSFWLSSLTFWQYLWIIFIEYPIPGQLTGQHPDLPIFSTIWQNCHCLTHQGVNWPIYFVSHFIYFSFMYHFVGQFILFNSSGGKLASSLFCSLFLPKTNNFLTPHSQNWIVTNNETNCILRL